MVSKELRGAQLCFGSFYASEASSRSKKLRSPSVEIVCGAQHFMSTALPRGVMCVARLFVVCWIETILQ